MHSPPPPPAQLHCWVVCLCKQNKRSISLCKYFLATCSLLTNRLCSDKPALVPTVRGWGRQVGEVLDLVVSQKSLQFNLDSDSAVKLMSPGRAMAELGWKDTPRCDRSPGFPGERLGAQLLVPVVFVSSGQTCRNRQQFYAPR